MPLEPAATPSCPVCSRFRFGDAAMIEMRDVHFRYPAAADKALRSVDLHVAPGEFVFLTGPSACGKSTLARLLNGLIPHVIPGELSGQVRVNGLDTARHPVAVLATQVGLVFQIPEAQLFNLTVEDEVAFGPRNLGLDGEEMTKRVTWALEAVGISGLRRRVVRELSGGEKQRVAIASVLALRPAALVLDEPLANLDVPGAALVLDTLRCLHREAGLTILLSEHKTGAILPLASRVLIMAGGRIVRDGRPEAVFAEREFLRKLGIRLPGEGTNARRSHRSPPRRFADLSIRLDNVSFGYHRRRPVLDGVSLTVGRGEFVALTGDNGAGKSTLARLVLGLLRPDRGKVWVRQGNGRLMMGREVGLLLQNPLEQLFCDTVDEEIAFGLENYRLPVREGVEQALVITDLSHKRGSQVQALSSGEQQRLALASVLALAPEILILDEPTLGQDWGHLSRLMAFVSALNRQGTTVVLITHDSEVVQTYAQRTVRLAGGRIVSDTAIMN